MKINPYFKSFILLSFFAVCIYLLFLKPIYGIIGLMVQGVITFMQRNKKSEPTPQRPLLSDFITEYGLPEEHIVTNPTRGNDIDGAILYYRRLGFLVINGYMIYKNDITGMTLKNIENPYLPCDYQIRIETSSEDHPVLFVSVGADSHWATDVTRQLQVALSER